jgi:hypothetical protein
MNYKILLATLLIWGLSCLPAQACPSGNPRSPDYIRRDNNRCEGIRRETVSGSFRLISLTTRGIDSLGNTLSLLVPRISGGSPPDVSVRSLGKNYQLDDLSLAANSSGFTFRWPTNVLNQEEVPVNSLRALASVNLGSQLLYVPVILGQPSGQYEIVLYSPSRVQFRTFEIRRNRQVVFSSPRNHLQPPGEVVFTWDGRNAPAGRYELHIVAEVEQRGRPPQRIDRSIIFEHNPSWLR